MNSFTFDCVTFLFSYFHTYTMFREGRQACRSCVDVELYLERFSTHNQGTGPAQLLQTRAWKAKRSQVPRRVLENHLRANCRYLRAPGFVLGTKARGCSLFPYRVEHRFNSVWGLLSSAAQLVDSRIGSCRLYNSQYQHVPFTCWLAVCHRPAKTVSTPPLTSQPAIKHQPCQRLPSSDAYSLFWTLPAEELFLAHLGSKEHMHQHLIFFF